MSKAGLYFQKQWDGDVPNLLNTGIRQETIEKEHNEYLLSVFEKALKTENRKTFSPEEIRGKLDH